MNDQYPSADTLANYGKTTNESLPNPGRPRPILPGESNLPDIDRYAEGFKDLYERSSLQDTSLPPLENFLEAHAQEIELMDRAAGLQIEWCIEAKSRLDQRYGQGPILCGYRRALRSEHTIHHDLYNHI